MDGFKIGLLIGALIIICGWIPLIVNCIKQLNKKCRKD
jgi:hypothetical protein